MQTSSRLGVVVMLLMMVAVAGCDKVANSSRAVQDVTVRAFNDTKSSWRDFFMYHPPVPDSLPQTRYCYQVQSDIVCYDSEQAKLTSKMVGYQDGENISWVQPGGGSLGASGGEPVALRPILPPAVTHVVAQNNTLNTGPVETPAASKGLWGTGIELPSFTKTTDEITVSKLPPTVVDSTSSPAALPKASKKPPAKAN